MVMMGTESGTRSLKVGEEFSFNKVVEEKCRLVLRSSLHKIYEPPPARNEEAAASLVRRRRRGLRLRLRLRRLLVLAR